MLVNAISCYGTVKSLSETRLFFFLFFFKSSGKVNGDLYLNPLL